MEVCPLVFQPLYRPKIWGGRNLARLFQRELPPGELIGESWECADLEAGQSVVARGPARGKTLRQLVEEWGPALLGRARLIDGRFPLLIKFLDANADLSVQVHPDADAVRRDGAGAHAKDEAWYILDAAENGAIYRGVVPGATREEIAQAVARRPESIVDYLRRVPVRPGQAYFLPSGTPHALGAGVVVVEVQTPSDTTYRLYDWGRQRPAGDAGLHVEQALACIKTDVDFSTHEQRSHVAGAFTTVTRLIACPSFIVEKVRFAGHVEQDIPYAEPVCWIVLDGEGEIHHGASSTGPRGRETFRKGEVVLLPAGLDQPRLKTLTDCVWLEVTIPTRSDLADYPRPPSSSMPAPRDGATHLVRINIDAKPGDGPA
jgi:mannose-6-phosphate isomerase